MKKSILLYVLLGIILMSCTENSFENNEFDARIEAENRDFSVSIEESENYLHEYLQKFNETMSRCEESAYLKKTIVERFTFTLPLQLTTRTERFGCLKNISPKFHIFNFKDNGGFAIMSGDNRVTPLLALAESGKFDPSKPIKENGLKIYVSNLVPYYLKEILDFHKTKTRVSLKPEYPLVGELNPIEMPLGPCKVKWSDDEPFNKYCPVTRIPWGGVSKVGCVAVALAQMLSIYEYPHNFNYKGKILDLNWDTLKRITTTIPNYGNNYIEFDVLAKFLLTLGDPCNLNMNYRTDMSFSEIYYIPRTLRNLGFYNCGSLYPYDKEQIVQTLKDGRYIIMAGYPEEGNHQGGHAWLVHGLIENVQVLQPIDPDTHSEIGGAQSQTKWYLRCNWGDAGVGDGYYLCGVFNIVNDPVINEIYNTVNVNYTGVFTEQYNYDIEYISGFRPHLNN